MKKFLTILLTTILAAGAFTGCGNVEYAEAGGSIITPKELRGLIGKDGVAIVDMQDEGGYAAQHVEGAVNIAVSSILSNMPVENSLAPRGRVQTLMSEAGIDNDTLIIIYDDGGSRDASRLWWTLLVYGHENTKVVSGGFPAIEREGIGLTSKVPVITQKEFEVTDRRDDFVATMKDVLNQVDDPDPDIILLDVRTDAEYQEAGKVPGSVMYDYSRNFYRDGMFLDVRATRINYLEAGIRPENEIITYCRTAMRSSCTFLSLYNAGYRNIKMYDGAYLEWSASGQNPVELPDGAKVSTSGRDFS